MVGHRTLSRHELLRYTFFAIFAFFFTATLSYLFAAHPNDTSATLVGFNPGNIINDYTMSNSGTMTEAQIQAFLKSKNPCNDTNIAKASQYPRMTYHIKDGHFVCMADETFGPGLEIGNPNGETAAHIIYQVSQTYQINPQVLIVLLEKEQGLITDTWPNSNIQYQTATGYGCPDTAACDTQYFGLRNQLENAAGMFRKLLNGGGTNNYPIGWHNIKYQANAPQCGSARVHIENIATGILYTYTPYTPNAAALAAGYGLGDACSAYGNRNFYNLFTDWFGSTQTHGPIDETIQVDTIKSDVNFTYTAHVQDIGWQKDRPAGEAVGTVEQSVRMEAFKITLKDTSAGNIVYRAHIQDIGWESTWHHSEETSGTSGQSKRIEALQLQLTGELAAKYDIYYRVYAQNVGWMSWTKNGTPAGTAGESLRLEALQITILAKNSKTAPQLGDDSFRPTITASTIPKYTEIAYKTHVQDIGWMNFVYNGKLSGTTGQSKRLEAIDMSLSGDIPTDCTLKYRVHVQDIGWMDWVENGKTAGTTGQSKRLEAIEIKLTGTSAATYNIKYRVHVQDIGWMDWVENGKTAGTTGQSKRLEAIEVNFIRK